MQLRGINFAHVLDASGARGWFGEGYSFHRFGRPIGLRFSGSTFVAKTTTLNARDPNGALRRDGLTPRVLGQHLVKINGRKSAVLNALGLPGPGFQALLKQGRWQQITEPFFLSFMAIATDPDESINEAREFVRILKTELPNFFARGKNVGLQVNFSCPNVHPREHVTNFCRHLDAYAALDMPVMAKLTATTSAADAIKIAEHQACDAICVSNTIPYGDMPDRIDWTALFRGNPLQSYGGGGLSGAPLLPIVRDWVAEARRLGLRKPINAGGGILKPPDVDVLLSAGASSVFIGSMAMLRPWNVQGTIRRANLLFAREEAAHLDLKPVGELRRA